jgi:pimeloyl-ACP methyl ester carboxylesterase
MKNQVVISKDGTSIAYDQTGNGQPLVLIDGAFCCRSFGPMATLASLLANHFNVVYYDRRGRGGSGDAATYTVDKEIEDLEALIKQLGGSAHVFGMSSGAALALFAAAKGLPITKLALFEPPFIAEDKTGRKPPTDTEAQLKSFIAKDQRGEAVKFFLTKVMGMPAPFVYIMRFMAMWPKMKAIANSLPYDAAIMGDFSLPTKTVSSIKVPTIVIGGEKSPSSLRIAVDAVAKAVPNSQLKMLKGQTHNVSMKLLAPVLDSYLQ